MLPTLSKASPAASSTDSPISRYEPARATCTSCVWPPETSSATNGNDGGSGSSIGASRCASMWCTATAGTPSPKASARPKPAPTISAPARPGPAV